MAKVTAISCDVKVYDGNSGNLSFGDGTYLATATEMRNGLKNSYGPDETPTREDCAAELIDIDDYLNQFDDEDISSEAQSLIDTMNRDGWGKSQDWFEAKRYLKTLVK